MTIAVVGVLVVVVVVVGVVVVAVVATVFSVVRVEVAVAAGVCPQPVNAVVKISIIEINEINLIIFFRYIIQK